MLNLNHFFACLATIAVAFSFSAHAQILYKVEKPGSDKTSYILGTHHFADLAVVDSIAELPEILKSVDKLYGEIDMAVMQDPAFLQTMQMAVMAPADSALNKVLTPAQLDSLGQTWKRFVGEQVPLEMMYAVKPAVISTQLGALMCQKALPNLDPNKGIDMMMQTRARELGKPVAGLESIDFQINMLYGTPIARQASDLMEIVADEEKEEKKAKDLFDAYNRHDINKIYEMLTSVEEEDPAELDKMIFQRNANWVKVFTTEMPTQSLMVVVGAGHLPGQKGVLQGLRDAGYKVTSVK